MSNNQVKKVDKYDEHSGKGALWASLIFVALFTALLWFGIWGLYMARV